jgi:DNA modification methylase
MTDVPCIRLSHLDEDKLRVFRIAENNLAQLAGWDTEALGLELQELSNIDLGFSLEVTGFSSARIDALIIEGDGGGENADALPNRPCEPVSRLDDLWVLGEHHLYCGDATSPDSMTALLGGEPVRAIFTDPPYNVAVAGHITSSSQHDEFVMASGEMSPDEFTAFLTQVLDRSRDALVPGGLCYFCMDWRHMSETLAAANAADMELLNLLVWDKTAGGMGSFYRSRHELIFLFRKPGASHLNRVELGKHGRNRANVWAYDGVNGFGAKKAKAREMHPTVKPMAMVRDAILDCSDRGDLVLDLFSGSGTTLIAAEQSRRRGRATELDPRYVDVGVLRWQDYTGQEARLASTGQTFREVREARSRTVETVVTLPAPATAPEARVRARTRSAPPVAPAA